MNAGGIEILSPQAAAAINTAIALAVHRRSGDPRNAVVVASDATSCRVRRIAAAFWAEVVEVESEGLDPDGIAEIFESTLRFSRATQK